MSDKNIVKKVSILSLHLGYGGIEKSVVALANSLSFGYDVEIVVSYKLYDKPAFDVDKKVRIKYLTEGVVPNKNELYDAISRKNLRDIVLESWTSYNILKIRKKTMVEFIKKSDSDIIISTRDIFDDWLGKYANESIVKIGWEHNHHHGNIKYANKLVSYAKKLDFFVVVSNDLERFYSNKLLNSNCKCVYIPNILDYWPKYVSRLDKKRLVSVGRLSSEKGFMDLLLIYQKLVSKYPDWSLDIVGDGPEMSLLKEFVKKNSLKKITLHGFKNKKSINELLHNSSIYLMTSYTEAFGIVLIEAMSHGVPCIAFDSAEGAREIIQNGKNGYLIKHRSVDEYLEKTFKLMEDKELRAKMGSVARTTSKKYSGDEVIDFWKELFDEKSC